MGTAALGAENAVATADSAGTEERAAGPGRI